MIRYNHMEVFEKYADPSTWAENQLLTVPVSKKELALSKAGATREIAYNTMVSALTAESMTVDKFGDEHMTPDHSSRLKAAELISRLNGDLKTETTIDNRTVNINGINAEAVTSLLHMVKDVAEQLASLRSSGRQTGEIIDVSTA